VAAVLEADRSRLAHRVEQANSAIKARINELEQDHMGTPEERMAIRRCPQLPGCCAERLRISKPHFLKSVTSRQERYRARAFLHETGAKLAINSPSKLPVLDPFSAPSFAEKLDRERVLGR